MSKQLKITCLDCGAVNRVPDDKLGAAPKCGVCGRKLLDGRVTEIDRKILNKAKKNDDIPLVVDFWAPWCGPCRMMAPEFAKAARNMAPDVRFAKINTEDYPQVSMEHGIRGIPLLIAFRAGRELARQAGAMPAQQIEAFLRAKAGAPV